jgi:hypothetical protein
VSRKVWSTGDELTADELNRIEDQVDVICTSDDRPTGVAGQFIYEVDTRRSYHYDGSGWTGRTDDTWTRWTPTIGAMTLGSTPEYSCAYRYRNGGIDGYGFVQTQNGGSFSVGTGATITLPDSFTVPSALRLSYIPFGRVYLNDSTWNYRHPGLLIYQSSTTLAMWFWSADATSSDTTRHLNIYKTSTATTPDYPFDLALNDSLSFYFYVPPV